MEHRYVSLLLKAIYIKKTGNTPPEQVDGILSEAQELMKSKGIKNNVLYAILFERSLINDDQNTYAFKALKVASEYSNLDTLDLIQFEHFMPVVISI